MIKYTGAYLLPQWVVWISVIMVVLIITVCVLLIRDK